MAVIQARVNTGSRNSITENVSRRPRLAFQFGDLFPEMFPYRVGGANQFGDFFPKRLGIEVGRADAEIGMTENVLVQADGFGTIGNAQGGNARRKGRDGGMGAGSHKQLALGNHPHGLLGVQVIRQQPIPGGIVKERIKGFQEEIITALGVLTQTGDMGDEHHGQAGYLSQNFRELGGFAKPLPLGCRPPAFQQGFQRPPQQAPGGCFGPMPFLAGVAHVATEEISQGRIILHPRFWCEQAVGQSGLVILVSEKRTDFQAYPATVAMPFPFGRLVFPELVPGDFQKVGRADSRTDSASRKSCSSQPRPGHSLQLRCSSGD